MSLVTDRRTSPARRSAVAFTTARPDLYHPQADEFAGRLRLARVQGVGDERLRRMADKGMTMGDLAHARQAADVWLTFRAGDAAA